MGFAFLAPGRWGLAKGKHQLHGIIWDDSAFPHRLRIFFKAFHQKEKF